MPTRSPEHKRAKKVKRGAIRFPSSITIDENDFYAIQNIFPRKRLPKLIHDTTSLTSRRISLPVVEIGDERAGYRVRKLRIPNERVWKIHNEDRSHQWIINSAIELDALETFHLDSVAVGDWIGRLTNLKELAICSSREDRLAYVPDAIGSITGLETLILQNGAITWQPQWFPTGIFDLTSLRELEISHTYFLPDGIQRLTNLEILRLPYSVMTSLPAAVRSLPRLRCLDLSRSSCLRKNLPEGITESMLRNQAKHVLGAASKTTTGSREFPARLWPLVLDLAGRSLQKLQTFDDQSSCLVPKPEDFVLFLVRKNANSVVFK